MRCGETVEDTSFTTLNFLAFTSGACVVAEAHRLCYFIQKFSRIINQRNV